MSKLKYPVGIQTFQKIIEEDYVYVDKTKYIKPLIDQGQFVFLSRPRRFGKSLMLSTLKAYFEGRRDLFKGLAADGMDLDWTPRPVLRFDFNAEDYSKEDGLEQIIMGFLREYEELYGRDGEDVTISQRFKSLIRRVFKKTNRKVVILVDEYDKPLLEIQEDPELLEKNQRILKSFYGNLKTMDEYIAFTFITGVARFTKVNIFSDLNNLNDISMANEYADICGWTETELMGNFQPGIEALAVEREEDYTTTLMEMRRFYDGYLFAPKGSRLYNPYSVLRSLNDKEIFAYWFATGTPTFLARWVKNNGISPWDVNGIVATKEELTSVGFDHLNPVPLMFQTGYLSVESYDRESQLYTLRLPNREVELGFYRLLLTVYDYRANQQGGPFDFAQFKRDLAKGDIQNFMKRLQSMLKALPGNDHNESTYRAITFLLAELCGTKVIAEHESYKGRSYLEVFTSRFIYLFEFKYNKSVAEAMNQIEDRDYAGRFAMDRRKIYLIGANFNERKERRGLEYEIRNG